MSPRTCGRISFLTLND